MYTAVECNIRLPEHRGSLWIIVLITYRTSGKHNYLVLPPRKQHLKLGLTLRPTLKIMQTTNEVKNRHETHFALMPAVNAADFNPPIQFLQRLSCPTPDVTPRLSKLRIECFLLRKCFALSDSTGELADRRTTSDSLRIDHNHKQTALQPRETILAILGLALALAAVLSG